MNDIYISKSKFIAGLQCHKLLWVYYHDKQRIPETDPSTQALFDQGQQVGELATTLFPRGIKITWGEGFEVAIEQSKQVLAARMPIFEASFAYGRAFARADILDPVENGQWDLIEVKSSTSVKEEHLQDVAFQRYIYEGAGIPIRSCRVMHIDNSYVRLGDLQPARLFKQQDVTGAVAALIPGIGSQLESLCRVLAQAECPEVSVGNHCSRPYDCPLQQECWSFLPERSVYSLYRGGAAAQRLLEQGILHLRDIPDDFPLTGKQPLQLRCEKTGEAHVDREALKEFLDWIRYPLYLLDFETIATAIPMYERLRPYQKLPFQYSLHVVREPGSEPQHTGFLSDGRDDPRPELLRRLCAELGTQGSIIAYNAPFEKGCLCACVEYFPEYGGWWDQVEPRFEDLLAPFRAFAYYHPAQNGNASLKAVLPALTGRSYEGLEIADGSTASLRFLEMAFTDMAEADRATIARQLEIYCAQDTSAMLDILNALESIIYRV